MKNHVLRPLWMFLALVVLVVAGRMVLVPKDFGIHERGYMYGWYRQSDIGEWKKVPVKYKGSKFCSNDCHEGKLSGIQKTVHARIQCENCHGPALAHPDKPEKLEIDKSRELCLRCHSRLNYPTSNRAKIRGIDPEKHNPKSKCVDCHNPHNPNLEGLK